jgi:hypothetical protein
MDEEHAEASTPEQQDWRQSEVEAFRRLLAARAHSDAKQLTTAEVDRGAVEASCRTPQPRVSLFEPGQPDPASAITSPTPAGKPQLDTALLTPRRRRPAWLLMALILTVAVGLLGAGFALGARWAGGTRPSAQAPATPVTQPPAISQTSIVARPVATSACLEAARRGDELIALLISNKRSQATKLLVPYHVASRQCARDASP